MVRQLGCAVGNVHYRIGEKLTLLHVCFRKERSDARSDQHIALTRRPYETLPIKHRELLSAALNQACTFQLSGGIRDGWSLYTQHLGHLADRVQRIAVGGK